MSILKIDRFLNSTNDTVLNINKIASGGYYSKQLVTQIDSATWSATTTWALGPVFSQISGISGNSLLLLTYSIPTRNDSTSWGGGYIEPQVNFNASSWQSLGSCGYDGGVMSFGNSAIGTYSQTLLIDPGISTAFSAQFRFYFRSYDGTVILNGSHDINAISGTATLATGDNGQQHFMHLIVEELARFS